MEYQVAILSQDAVFARMLEIEFSMQNLQTFSGKALPPDSYALSLLLDIDSVTLPDHSLYGKMFGFTCASALRPEEELRACSMILHRPFEVSRLRQEVLSCLFSNTPSPPASLSATKEVFPLPVLDTEGRVLNLGNRKVSLTPVECTIMQLLLARRGETVSKEEIGRAIGDSSANKTEVYICYLRRKTDSQNGLHLIRTVRGKGYFIP